MDIGGFNMKIDSIQNGIVLDHITAGNAMKIYYDLGLDKLADAANEISEEFRPGNPRRFSDDEVKAKLQSISILYQKTLDGIDQYLNS